jgi:hypothetical protein
MRFRVLKGAFVVFAAMLVWAPGALAASPKEIYRDLADNGRLDGTYTQAELRAFLQNATVQGYGNPVVGVVPPVQTPGGPGGSGPGESGGPIASESGAVAGAATPVSESGVAGVATPVSASASGGPAAGGVSPAQTPLAETATVGALPFTGIELGMFALVGAALLLGGLLLRTSARKR